MKWRLLSAAVAALFGSGCSLILASPVQLKTGERLQAFPTTNLPITGQLKIRWDQHMIPFIEAEKDEDLALALGLVHAHLRLGQLELMRYLAHGRLAELAGPLAVDLDKTLRLIQLGKAADATIAAMPPESRHWAERFLTGINTYIARTQDLPPDLIALGVTKIQPWSLPELVTVWRLASIDVNWTVYGALLELSGKPGFDQVQRDILENGFQSVPSFTKSEWGLGQLIFDATHTGSNSLVVGKAKAAAGPGLIANDPHLGLTIPNTWLIAGYRSPSYHAVGLMIPALPFLALGRNDSIAWGGTNMWGLSTHLFELSEAEAATATTHTETIKVRDWFDTEVAVRNTRWGPIVSDSPFLKALGKQVACRWVGHEVSDELTAFLQANRAKSAAEFHAAFATYGVSAQNLLVVDSGGHTGHVLAYRQPLRPDEGNRQLLQPSSNNWSGFRQPAELPYASDPPAGFIASANNQPTATEPPIGWYFQSSERIQRWQDLASQAKKIDVAMLKAWQADTYSAASLELVQQLKQQLPPVSAGELGAQPVWRALVAWNGCYEASSPGPVAFETLMWTVARQLLGARYRDDDLVAFAMRAPSWKVLLQAEIAKATPDAMLAVVRAALKEAAPQFAKYPTWAAMHRVAARHPLGFIPVIGRRFRLAEFGSGGGADTIFKTATGFTGDLATSYYGTNARHISDLSDLDANYFVLFGGQDGWLTSPQTLDQLPLWQGMDYIKLPLSTAEVERVYSAAVMTLTAKAS